MSRIGFAITEQYIGSMKAIQDTEYSKALIESRSDKMFKKDSK